MFSRHELSYCRTTKGTRTVEAYVVKKISAWYMTFLCTGSGEGARETLAPTVRLPIGSFERAVRCAQISSPSVEITWLDTGKTHAESLPKKERHTESR